MLMCFLSVFVRVERQISVHVLYHGGHNSELTVYKLFSLQLSDWLIDIQLSLFYCTSHLFILYYSKCEYALGLYRVIKSSLCKTVQYDAHGRQHWLRSIQEPQNING